MLEMEIAFDSRIDFLLQGIQDEQLGFETKDFCILRLMRYRDQNIESALVDLFHRTAQQVMRTQHDADEPADGESSEEPVEKSEEVTAHHRPYQFEDFSRLPEGLQLMPKPPVSTPRELMSTCITSLGCMKSETAAESIITFFRNSEMPEDLRAECARVLGELGTDKAKEALLKQLYHRMSPILLASCVEALRDDTGSLEIQEALLAWYRALQEYDVPWIKEDLWSFLDNARSSTGRRPLPDGRWESA